jgi:O-antigen/teichoic acid export membrane protein
MHIISRGMDLSLLPQIGSYSSLLLANQLANQINTRTDEIVIGAMLPIRLVAPFGIARRLSEAPQLFTNQFLKVIMPMASDLDAAQDQQRLRELHLTGTRIALLLFTPIGLAVTILSAPLLTVWVGAAYAQYNGLVGILVTAGLLNLTCWPAAAILQGMARHKVVAIASLVAAIGNLALSLFLVGPFGLSGVALGTLISYLIEWLFILPYTLRVLHVSIGEALRAIFLPVVMPALAMVLVLFAFQAWLHPTSLFMLGVCVAVSGLCYLLVYLPFSHTTFERKLVLQGLDQIWQRSLRLRAR